MRKGASVMEMGKESERRPTYEIMGGFPVSPGVARQVVLSELDRPVQTLPIEQGEKVLTLFSETGDLRGGAASARRSAW